METFIKAISYFIILIGIIFLLFTFNNLWESLVEYQDSTHTTGEVLRVETTNETDAYGSMQTYYTPVVKFEDQMGLVHQLKVIRGASIPVYSAGEMIDIMYPQRDYSKVEVIDFAQYWGSKLFMFFLSFGVFSFGFLPLWLMKRSSRK